MKFNQFLTKDIPRLYRIYLNIVKAIKLKSSIHDKQVFHYERYSMIIKLVL